MAVVGGPMAYLMWRAVACVWGESRAWPAVLAAPGQSDCGAAAGND